MREVSTAVRKFCLLHPSLHRWRSKHRFVAWIRRLVYSGRVKALKEVINFCTRTVLGTRSPNPRPPLRVPRFLLPLLRLGRKGKIPRVAVISILNSIRLILLSPTVDVRTISAPCVGSLQYNRHELSCWFKAARTFMGSFGLTTDGAYTRSFEWSRSWSAGPNGRPAWDHAYEDLVACFSTELGEYLTLFALQLPLTFRKQ